ncbi:hypothetical protein B0H15DRAFT_930523 [Mycena belliarum]|uniref:Uncharacterized protein n=1 Tax=Mycena belliarum TaxID=1033014 RepID=A0AAD6UAD2_9AGAR|nr:hypothetical protein B0H15DRAFT_930523 [Mycena belliae]
MLSYNKPSSNDPNRCVQIEFWLEDSGGRRIPYTEQSLVPRSNKIVADADIEESSCYVAYWRAVKSPVSALCELFVNLDGKDTRAAISYMERKKKRSRSQSSKNKLVHPFTRFSMLRAPSNDEPEGYVRLELRRFRGEVEVQKSDAQSDEFIVDLIDDPNEGYRPYITMEFRLRTFPKRKPGSQSTKRERDSTLRAGPQEEFEPTPKPAATPSKRPRKTPIRDVSTESESDEDRVKTPLHEGSSESDSGEALVRKLKAAEEDDKKVKAALKAKLKATRVRTAALRKFL